MPRSVSSSSDPARTDRRAEGSSQPVDRRWQCRDHRARSEGTRGPTGNKADRLFTVCSMRAAQQALRDAERRFPVRIKIAVPPEGLGFRLDQIIAWLDANCGADGWILTLSSTR